MIRKASAIGSSANIKFSKNQLSKMIQPGGIRVDLIEANTTNPLLLFPPFRMINLLAKLYG